MEDRVYVAQVCLELLILPPQPSVGTTVNATKPFSLALDCCFDRRVLGFPCSISHQNNHDQCRESAALCMYILLYNQKP